jgi:hypothetical protein
MPEEAPVTRAVPRVEEVMSMLRWVATWQGRRVAMEASSVRWVMSQMTYIVMF